MGADAHDPDSTDDSPVAERYTAIRTDDAERDDAWIQAANATCLTEAR